MCDHPEPNPVPAGYRLIDDTTLSFLWFHTAGMALHYLGVGTIQPVSDAERIDCVARLAKLHREHEDVLSDESLLVVDCLIAAALDLMNISGH